MPLPYQVPLHTRRFVSISRADVAHVNRIFTAEGSTENRGQLQLWIDLSRSDPERLVWISPIQSEEMHVRCASESQPTCMSLHDTDAIKRLYQGQAILIDISGLPHPVWASLLRAAHEAQVETYVLYAEPDSYKEHPSPSSASYFDLSVEFGGLAPLPGFARLSGPPNEQRCFFVALLGFEGNRPSNLVVQIDPVPRVIPVIGVPGFQLEYPSFTVACNRDFLDAHRAYDEIRLARASCPFEVVTQLRELHRDYPDFYLYIAPVGTKPHALGAVMYALERPDMTELMFDYPVRKPGRTRGVGVIHMFDLKRTGQ